MVCDKGRDSYLIVFYPFFNDKKSSIIIYHLFTYRHLLTSSIVTCNNLFSVSTSRSRLPPVLPLSFLSLRLKTENTLSDLYTQLPISDYIFLVFPSSINPTLKQVK